MKPQNRNPDNWTKEERLKFWKLVEKKTSNLIELVSHKKEFSEYLETKNLDDLRGPSEDDLISSLMSHVCNNILQEIQTKGYSSS